MTAAVLQGAVGESLAVDAAWLVVLTVLSAVLGAGMGLLHRWYANERVPDGLAVLVGLSGVALSLNTSGALGEVIGGQGELVATGTALFNVVVFFVAAVAADVGGRAGDRLGLGFFAVSGARTVERDVSRIVKTVGRVITVEVPEEIGDIDGYDPVDPVVKEALAGQQLVFPRRLTLEALRARFVERLRTDYGVGHVDVDFADDGSVEYLALGSREAGLGPTLPPGSAAVAVRADPPNNASPGDAVQVWALGDPRAGDGPERVLTAEIRGTADDVVTLAVDEAETDLLDPEARYRLVTLPAEVRADREFAGQLRSAAETMGAVNLAVGSPLAASTVGALDLAVVAVRPADGPIEAIPPRDRPLAAGETVYAIARPERLRKFEAAAGGTPDAPGVPAE
ncbi:potassium transporter TrkA [Natronomonas marina]|uniref:potassium transporter TrkA n=1 Tax=Natronomonas marina TaxID=2961939 RepID=UPI0020C9A3C4|nr:potassium transporter TrkA [Natronomonas marina]